MSASQLLIIFCLIGTMSFMAACAMPDVQSPTEHVGDPTTEPAVVSNQTQTSVESNTDENRTTITTTNGAALPDQTDAGAAVEETPTAAQEAAEPTALPVNGTLTTYTDATYHFQVAYPADFVIRTQSAADVAFLEPAPILALRFLAPDTAASDLGDLELPDLEIRLYEEGAGTSLQEWLVANKLLPADGSVPLNPFATDQSAGVELCSALMLFPNCSYLFQSEQYIYQLIPATQEGEAILQTLQILAE